MWTWFRTRRPSRRPGFVPSLRERLEDRVLFDAVPDAPVTPPDQPIDDPLAPAVEADASLQTATVETEALDAAARTEVVFVDKRVGNYQALVAELLREGAAEVHFLDRNSDGLAQIEAALAGRGDVDALHIISHGEPGQLLLGTTTLTQQSMQQVYADALKAIGGALTDEGDILVYGCEFAQGTKGFAAAQTLAQLTGADVAASVDDTGHENLQGNWVLELKIGSVEADVIVSDGAQQLFGGVLAEPIAAFLISDATDQVIKLSDRTNTSTASVVGPMTNTFSVEALVRDTTTGNIYASDANRFGIVNLDSGTVTVLGNYGTIGANALDQVISLTVHPTTGEIWAVDSQGSGPDYLFKVNKTTGAYIPNAFGAGVHHLAIDTAAAGVGEEIDDLAWGTHPTLPGQYVLYASMSNRLISINTSTGAVTAIGTSFGTNITDMEGLSADENGNLWGTTGNSTGLINRVWTINKTTGAATEVGQMPIGGDYEGIVFLTQPVDLEADITVTQSTPDEGETITYVIKVTNADPSILASGVQLRSLVPSGLTFLSSTSTKGSYDNSTGVWNIGVMSAGTTQTLQIAYRVNSGTAGQTINRIAEIYRSDNPDPDSDPDNGIVGEDDQDTVSLTVASYSNNPPVAVNNTYTTALNTALTVNGTNLPTLLANDSDPNGDTLSVNTTPVTGPSNGTLTLNANGTFLYSPNSGYSGTDTFVYQISDGHGGTDQATVSIEVTPGPIAANNDNYTTAYNAALTVGGTGILVNDVTNSGTTTSGATMFWSAPADTNGNTTWEDSEPAGAELDFALGGSVSRTTTPTTSRPAITAAYNFTGGSGTAADFEGLTGDPTDASATFEFWFNPAGTGNGDVDLLFETGGASDGVSFVLNGSTLEFHVTDRRSGTDYTATATASIASLITGNEFIQVAGVIDLENDQLRLFVNGSLVSTVNASGDIRDWGDGNDTGLGAVNNSVKSATASPTAYEGEVAFGRFYESKLTTPQVLTNYQAIAGGANVTHVNGSTSNVGGMITLPSGAQLTQQANGTFVYNPNGAFNGLATHSTATDSYTYTITDGSGNTDTATVTITITGPNSVPVAVNNTYRVDPNTTLHAATILGNDSDADGDTLTVNTTPVTNVSNGILTLHADGTFVYTPNPGYVGSDSFVYQISDGYGGTATATVFINVAPNTAPTTSNSTVTGVEDATYTFQVGDFPFSDVDGDSLHSFRITSIPVAGELRYNGVAITAGQVSAGFDVLSANIGLLTFVPTANQNGTGYAAFGFRVSDGIDRSAASTMTINVTAVNDAPSITVPGAQPATAGVSKVISGVSFADIDAGSSNVTVTLSIPAGTLTLSTGVSGGVVAGEVTGNGSGSVSITSTIAKINATLADATGLQWLYNTSGTQTLTVNINDLGNTGVDPSTVGQPATGMATNEQASATIDITIPAPTLVVNDVAVVEGTDAFATFTVSLSNPTTMPIVMNLALTAGTATGGGVDYGASDATNIQVWNGSAWVNATTATIAAGATSVQVRTPIIDDFRSDSGETFALGATVTSGTTANGSASGTGTIQDEPAGAGDSTYVSIAGPASVVEGAATTNYTVSLTQPAVTDVTVTLTYSGTAVDGTDFTGQATVVVLAGTSSRTFTLPTTGDSVYEGNEPFTVTITGTSGGGLERLLIDTANDYVTTTIVDDDTPTLSINSVTVTEGTDAHAVFTLSLSNPSTQNVVVALSLANGTATVGTDTGTSAALQYYNGSIWVTVPVSGQVTIAAGETSLQLRTAITDDLLDEFTETYTLTAAHVSGTVTSTADVVGTGTILDDDAPPSLTIDDVTRNESDGTLTFTVTLNAASGKSVTVNYETVAGSAVAGSDYTHTSGTLTFNPGETTKTVLITLTDDNVVEATETFTLSLSNATNATIGDNSGLGTITDDDATALTINDVTQIEGDSGTTTYTFTVSLSQELDTAVSVNWATANGTTNGTDIAAQSGTVTFAAGETSKTFNVTVSGDQTVELDETFNVNLSGLSAGGRNVSVTDAQGVGTIANDDAAALTINDVTQNEGNSGSTTYTFTVSLDRAVDTAVSVNWATANVSTNGTDLAAQSGSVTFAAGETSKTFSVNVSGDQTVELDETFNVNLSGLSAGGRNVSVTDAQGVGTVVNDDAAQLSLDDLSQSEGDSGSTTYTFTVSLDRAIDAAVSIDWSTSHGSTNGTDLASQTGTVTFAAGETIKTFTVSVNGDQTVELDETFQVNLSNLNDGGRNVSIADAQGVGTIENDDAAQVSIDDVSHTEGDSGTTTYTFTLTLDQPVDAAVSVNWATAHGTTNNADLAGQSGTVAFAAGETSKTITVTVNTDLDVESNETFAVNLSGLSAAGRDVTIGDAQGIGTINDDDSAQITIDDVSHTEGDSGTLTYTFTVSLDRTVATDVSVDWTAANVTTNGSDLVAQSGTVTFLAGQTTKTFSVTVNRDQTVELDETFAATLSNLQAGGSAVSISDAQGIGTIVNDDAATVSIDDMSHSEGDSGTTTYTFTVSLDRAIDTAVSVNWGTANDSTSSTDLASQSGTVTLNAGETSKTFSVTVSGDQTVELDEQFFANLSGLSAGGRNVSISDSQGVGTVVNDDAAAISIDDVSQSEGDSGTTTYTFTVTLDQPVDAAVSVNWATAHGTTNGTDLGSQSGTVTFAAGETTQTFSVTVNGDQTVELNEIFAVNLSGLNATGRDVSFSDAQGIGTLVNDDAAQLTIDDVSQSEGNSGTTTYTFTVSLDQPVDANVSVNWSTAHSTTNGTDLGSQSGTVTIAAGTTTATLTVTVSGDQTVELDESFAVNLSGLAAGGRNVSIANSQGIGTITNDDAAQVTINDVTHAEGDSGTTTYTFTVSLDQAVDAAVSVNWAVAHNTTDGSDLAAQSGTVTFNAGETSKTFSVTVNGDQTVELDEQFFANLSGLSAGGRDVTIADAQSVGTITNDDAASISIDDVSHSEGNSGTTTYTFTVSLDQPVDAAVSVNWATANDSTNATDLGAQSGTVTFNAGETTKTFSVTVNGDQTVELDEQFFVNLSGLNDNGRSVSIGNAQGIGTITNDDAVQMSIDDVSLAEGDSGTTTYMFTVSLDRAVDTAVSVNWGTAHGTTNGTDLTTQSGSVTFAAGELTKTFSVTVIGDQTVELDETFQVNLSGLSAAGRNVTISDAQGIGTITNDDTASFTIDNVTETEGDSGTVTYTFTVSLDQPVDTAVSVNWATAHDTTNAVDLTAQSGTVTFAAGETTKTFSVTVNSDTTVELNETFDVNLTGLSAGGRSVSIGDSQGVGTIIDDDGAQVSINDVSQVEGDAGATTYTFTISLDQAAPTNVSIDWSTSHGSTDATDLAVQSGSVIFLVGETSKTISVTVNRDQTVELDETFFVNLSNLVTGGSAVMLGDSQGVGTVTNDDAAALTIDDVIQVEGDSGTTTYTFTVSLDRAVDTAVSVNWAAAHGTTDATDLAAQSGTVTIAAGEMSQTFTVTVNRDTTVELNESFNVNLSGLSAGGRGVAVTDSQGVGTITNDDAAALTIDDVTHSEGDSGTTTYSFTVSLDRAVDTAISVNWATVNGTTNGADLAAQSGSVTFAAGETSKTFSVTVSGDQTIELNETFHIDLSGLSAGGRNVTISDAQGVGMLTNDDAALLSIDDVTETEGDSGTTTYTFTVSLDQPVDAPVSVNWGTAHGTTTNADLSAQSGLITFAAGETTKTFTVNVNADLDVESNETFAVDLSGLSTSGHSVTIGDAQGIGTIVDDDAAQITIDDVSQSEGDSGTTTYTFTVSLDQMVSTNVSVDWAMAHLTTDATDLAAQSGTVTFLAGQTTKTFTVTVNRDQTVELDETFAVNLSNLAAGGSAVTIGDMQGIGTITNDDAAAVTIDDVSHAEGNSGTTTYTFTVSLDRPVDTAVSVNWATANGTTNGADLAAQSGSVMFAAGETTKTFTVNVNGDRLVEADESFVVNLIGLSAAGRSVSIADPQGQGTLVNDDSAPTTLTNTLTTDEDTDLPLAAVHFAYADADGDPLVSIRVLSLPTDGSLLYQGVTVTQTDIDNGLVIAVADIDELVFRPDPDESGVLYAQFVFSVSDGVNDSAPAFMRFHVTPQNDPPIANDNEYNVVEDDSVGGNVITDNTGAGVDSDIDGGALTVVDADGNGLNGITPISGPTHGTLTLNSNGTFSYSPTSNYVGPDTFTYRITDGNGGFSSAVVTINVTPDNDPPTATDNSAAVTEDGPTTDAGNVLTDDDGDGVDTDLDLDSLTVEQVHFGATTVAVPGVGSVNIAGQYGTLTISASGSYTYALNNALAAVQQLQVGEVLTEVFNYTATDGLADATANLTVTIHGQNDNPVGVGTIPNQSDADSETITALDVSGFFDDADLNDSLTYDDLGTLPSGLSIDLNSGVITGTLPADASQGGVGGLYTVTIEVTDDHGRTATRTFTWTVTNPAPIATNNSGSVTEDGPTVDNGNVLSDNDGTGLDSDPDGDAIFVTEVDGVLVPGVGAVVINGQYGTLTIAADGGYTYALHNSLPAVQSLGLGETLTESFNYTLSDGEGGTDTAALVITVDGRNDVPVASGVLLNRTGVDGVAIPPVDVSGSFSDPDSGATLTYSAGGTLPPGLTLDPQTGIISGTPTANASQGGVGGAYTVTITATDEHGASTSLTFTWTMTNPAPTAHDNDAAVREDGPLSDSGNVLTDNDGSGIDNDPDGDALRVTQVNGTAVPAIGTTTLNGQYGTLQIAASGAYTYTLHNQLAAVHALGEGDLLSDVFTYAMGDGQGGTDSAQLVVTIRGTNDPPIATDDANRTDSETSVGGTVLPNDRDPDGGTVLTVTAVNGTSGDVGRTITLASGALLILQADGTYRYDPNGAFDDLAAGQTARDRFTYTISDGRGGSATATVVITIEGINDPPSAWGEILHTPPETPLTVTVLDNDTDPNGDPLSVILLDPCQEGTVIVNADRTITFLPKSGFTGMAYIRYLAEDPHGASSPATLMVMVDEPAQPEQQFLFGFDSFNNFSQPRQVQPVGQGHYEQPLLTREIFTLAPEPIFSGYARPGTMVIGRIYDARGVLIGEGFAHADPGGNWMMQFAGTVRFERYRIEFDYVVESQDIYGYIGLDPSDNSYQAMQPLTGWEEPLSVATVLRESPWDVLQRLHREAQRPLGLHDR